ncbi:hypothetical protein SLEP1_g51394 [Rubroshorea leprosula]|uniref:C2H2-type domain-containing protein n=1 Tax=Rubroshorea leprosula TaxID=152421 RepID=A0AAV5M403_9ROSI|nr:hypothetical protein SLEP1_g51394 [Rubroshorea leprosula]
MSTPRDSSDDISPEQQPEEGEIISPQRETAGNEEVTEGDGGGEGRKREREDDSVASSSSTRPRRRGELDAPRSVDPACYVCGKQFASWKAVFGHLRSHPRAHSGAFPPPKFSPDSSPNPNKELQEQLAPTLLNLACEALEKMEQDQEPTPDAAAQLWEDDYGGFDNGIFDLEEERIKEFEELHLDSQLVWPPPIWVMPDP